MAIRVSSVGVSVWVKNPSRIRVSSVGTEVWLRNPSNIRVTQVGLEVWRTVAGSPLTTTGHADGFATAYAISSLSRTTVGNADGYATAKSAIGPPPSPIIAFMGV